MISTTQFFAARILVKWSREQLASSSGLSVNSITDLEESGVQAEEHQSAVLRRALEAGGITFVPEGGSMGAGVRLKFTRLTVESIEQMESEGGPVADDDVW